MAYRVNAALEPLLVPITDLHEDPKNARTHSVRNVNVIAASLERFGQQKPIVVDAAGRALAGNGTLRAAELLGWTHLAAVRFDGPHARAYAISDNRSAELSEWDRDELLDGLAAAEAEADDLAALGWSADEVAALREAGGAPPKERAPGGAREPMQRIRVTEAERLVIQKAVAQVRTQSGDGAMPEGRAVELFCADWLAGR